MRNPSLLQNILLRWKTNRLGSIRKVFASTTPGVHIQIALPSKFKMDVNIWKLLERGAAISIIRQVALFM